MNYKKSDLRDAMNDLQHIRSVMDGPAALGPLAPYFLCTGLVWLAYAMIMASITLPDMLSYLWPNIEVFSFDPYGGVTMLVYNYGKWVIWAFLLVQCGLWQREKSVRVLTGTARRSLTTWQVFLALYLVFGITLEVIGSFALGQEVLVPGIAGPAVLWQISGVLEYALPILFPALPLILMGNHLEDRALGVFGWLSLLWAVALVAFSMYGVYQWQGLEVGILLASIVLSLGMGFLAPVGLLLTAWRLGKKGA